MHSAHTHNERTQRREGRGGQGDPSRARVGAQRCGPRMTIGLARRRWEGGEGGKGGGVARDWSSVGPALLKWCGAQGVSARPRTPGVACSTADARACRALNSSAWKAGVVPSSAAWVADVAAAAVAAAAAAAHTAGGRMSRVHKSFKSLSPSKPPKRYARRPVVHRLRHARAHGPSAGPGEGSDAATLWLGTTASALWLGMAELAARVACG